MLPDRVSNPGPLTYESGALPIALRGPANDYTQYTIFNMSKKLENCVCKTVVMPPCPKPVLTPCPILTHDPQHIQSILEINV